MDDNATEEKRSDTPSFELSLKGEGIEVEREVDERVALDVLAVVMGGDAAAARPPRDIGRAQTGGRAQSLREFLDEVEAKRNVDKIVAIASYLETQRGYDTFSPDQVKKEFKSAREPAPANYPRDFRWAVSTGWLAPTPEDPDEFYVTESGRKAIDGRFSADVKKTTTVAKTERRRRPRAKAVDDG